VAGWRNLLLQIGVGLAIYQYIQAVSSKIAALPRLLRHPRFCFCNVWATTDINATIFLDFSNIVVFIVDQALRRFDAMIPQGLSQTLAQ
jgi:hypothetical protein